MTLSLPILGSSETHENRCRLNILKRLNSLGDHIGLPDLSGDEATAQIKPNLDTKDIPVVIQTAFGTGPNAKHAIEVGAAEILHKPISIADIKKVLEKYLSAQYKPPETLPGHFDGHHSGSFHQSF
jgi:DNA-binding NarL/FixJ family response regulator